MVRGVPHGFGIKEFSNQDLYEGQFQNGKAHGHGTLRYKSDANLEKYVGLGRMVEEGFGTLVFTDSSRMVGHWAMGSLLYGDFQRSDGTIISGKWNRDSLSEGKCEMNSGISFRVSLIRMEVTDRVI